MCLMVLFICLGVLGSVRSVVRAADQPAGLAWVVPDATNGVVAQYGVTKLKVALRAQGWTVKTAASLEAAKGDLVIVAGTSTNNGAAARLLRDAGVALPDVSEALTVKRLERGKQSMLVLCGADERGLMYAALDVAEQVGWATNAAEVLSAVQDVSEKPYTRDRAVSMYTMNREYWESRFYDERYWARYFDMLAANRFNKVRIVFGYENGGFLAPCYPYFFHTPGFPDVHMENLTREQQKVNVAALNRLIEMAHERGIAVAIGIWDHIYRAGVQSGGAEWLSDYRNQPIPNTVSGVTSTNLNAYTLASLKVFFKTFPGIDEIQFRIHEESGLKPEEMDGFWRTVFTMAKQERPDLLFEARGKGTPDSVIDTALDLGIHLRVETKYWMEQMGLPFPPTHVNPADQQNRRHGYADFLKYPKRYDMNWTLWNGGTARVLLWGDPDYVRRFLDTTFLYDSPNWDVNEPLATKMEAQKPDVKPFDLMPERYRYYDYEFERYWYFFKLWGRLGYDPQTPPETWDNEFVRRFGKEAAPEVEAGLNVASRVLPYIVSSSVYPYSAFPTTRGWAERQSLGTSLPQYARNTGTDPQQFEGLEEAARRTVTGGTTTRRTPEDVSRWFDQTADEILSHIDAAQKAIGTNNGKEFDSTITDLRILASLAKFHARRSIAAVHYNIYRLNGNLGEFDEAMADERSAIKVWRGLVNTVGDRYTFDLAMGARRADLCGHWSNELDDLERGLVDLEVQRQQASLMAATHPGATNAVWQPSLPPNVLPQVNGSRVHTAKPLEPLRIVVHVTSTCGIKSVQLRYRHVTQFEDYATLDMLPDGQPDEFAATVPADFIVPEWDFMYFIEALDNDGYGTQWPDLSKEAPYIFVHLNR